MRKGDYFLPNTCMPPMLNEIIMEFGMSSPVFNMPVRLKKSLDPVRVPMEFDTIKSSK
jgi:hypothetical protein